MIWLVLMFGSAVVAICAGIAIHDWAYTAMAVGTLCACCLGLAFGHGLFESSASKKRRSDQQREFEEASHAAYLLMVESARRRKA